MLVAVASWYGATPVDAQEAGTWQFRVKALGVLPDEAVTIDGVDEILIINDSWVPSLDITYFFTDRIAAELILATSEHDLEVVGTAALGSVRLLPPTLSLQVHPVPSGRFQPYVGVGGNLTLFYDVNVASGLDDVDYDTALGVSVQLGTDVALGESPWFLNVDLKKLFLRTDVSVEPGGLVADATLDPWILSAGIGYRISP